MVEVAASNATYYYHYDGLGFCIASTDANANTVQLYVYNVYGQVTASDPNHTNPFLFTSRRFDADTGLYYYCARYHNPCIGRFLRTDSIGYKGAMSGCGYCGNRLSRCRDPCGLGPVCNFGQPPWGDGLFGLYIHPDGSVAELIGTWNYEGVVATFEADPVDVTQYTFYDACDACNVSVIVFVHDDVAADESDGFGYRRLNCDPVASATIHSSVLADVPRGEDPWPARRGWLATICVVGIGADVYADAMYAKTLRPVAPVQMAASPNEPAIVT